VAHSIENTFQKRTIKKIQPILFVINRAFYNKTITKESSYEKLLALELLYSCIKTQSNDKLYFQCEKILEDIEKKREENIMIRDRLKLSTQTNKYVQDIISLVHKGVSIQLVAQTEDIS
jgi:hypothetical protein